jgi:hypothetical protein
MNSIINWATLAVSLTQNPSELTVASVQTIVQIVARIIAGSSALKVPYADVSSILSSLDAISGSIQASGISSMTFANLLNSYSTYVLSQMEAQQFDENYSFDSFKISSGVKAVSNSAIIVSTPLTDSETFAGVKSDTFSLETMAGVSNVRVSLLINKWLSLSTELAAAVHSNPITLILPDVSVCATTGCVLSMVLQSVVNVTYINGSSNAPSFVTTCGLTNRTSTTRYSCPSGLNVTTFCDGLSPGQNITTRCPYLVTTPNCGRVLSSGSSTANDICTLVSYTSTQTTCQCQVPIALLIGSTRRRRLDNYYSGRQYDSYSGRQLLTSGDIQMGTITAVETVINSLDPAAPTLFPTPEPTRQKLNNLRDDGFSTRNTIILAVVLSIFGCGLIAGGFAYYAHGKRIKTLPIFSMSRVRATGRANRVDDGGADFVPEPSMANIFVQDIRYDSPFTSPVRTDADNETKDKE